MDGTCHFYILVAFVFGSWVDHFGNVKAKCI